MTNAETATGRQHRRHRSRTEADQLAAEYEASGLNREVFCRQKDMPLKTLGRYVTRYRKQQAGGSEPQRWIPVEIAAGQPRHGSELSVLLSGGRRIEVKRGFDVGTLRQLVAVLERG